MTNHVNIGKNHGHDDEQAHRACGTEHIGEGVRAGERLLHFKADIVTRRPEPSGRTRLLSVEQAADYLGLSAGTMRNWISMRRIEHVKVGRLTRVPISVLDRYVSTHTVRALDEQEADR
jgi:excisionase family DNA binding protein